MKRTDTTHKFHYQCSNCNKTYAAIDVMYLCPECEKQNTSDQPPNGVLNVVYDYDNIRKKHPAFKSLQRQQWLDLLPLNSIKSFPPLHIGNTPIYKTTNLEGEKLSFQLLLKDDARQPTFSFKDRASALVSAYAKEHKIKTIVAASTGNAGSSLAGICASQHQKAVIIVPAKAPLAKLKQILMYGATIVPVDGTYDDAFELSIKATKEYGWYNRNTAYNPLTIEGKKTAAFEIFSQMKGQFPDHIFIPTGDGVILSGLYKGFEDLFYSGYTDRIPVLVAVQAEGSSNLINNLDNSVFVAQKSQTIADSISVDIPRNFYLAKHYLKKWKGESIRVSDKEILTASSKLARNTGVFAEPASAAAFAGFLAYWKKGLLQPESRNLVLLTGSGLKDLNAVAPIMHMPKAISPTLENLKSFLR
ncbi:MAG: threonine synthase [Bacteroidales bacterium]|nr:threonine synthase [Bacteroidales bacterium]MDP2237227.1 threonine synthase [Bacteroidales bacterium]